MPSNEAQSHKYDGAVPDFSEIRKCHALPRYGSNFSALGSAFFLPRQNLVLKPKALLCRGRAFLFNKINT